MTEIKKYRLAAVLAVSAAMALPAVAAPIAITREQIAAAIGAAGMRVSPEQVTLLSDVVAATGAPALKVESVDKWDDHRTRVRLDCAKRTDCLPFVVLVSRNGDTPIPSTLRTVEQSSTAVVPTPSKSISYVVHSGSTAELHLEGSHVHIRLAVVCLENGAKGQTIRVASRDHKQTYKAEVMEDLTLRGTL